MFIACMAVMPVWASMGDAIVIGDSNDDSLVTGTVTRLAGGSLYVESMGREIEIEMDKLNVDNFRNLFQPGTVLRLARSAMITPMNAPLNIQWAISACIPVTTRI